MWRGPPRRAPAKPRYTKVGLKRRRTGLKIRCGPFNLHCTLWSERDGCCSGLTPHSRCTFSATNYVGVPGSPHASSVLLASTQITPQGRQQANLPLAHNISDTRLLGSIHHTASETAATTCRACPLITPTTSRMDRSPSKRVLTESTLDSQSVVDGSTRNDGYGA
jgi:hypothetical protein